MSARPAKQAFIRGVSPLPSAPHCRFTSTLPPRSRYYYYYYYYYHTKHLLFIINYIFIFIFIFILLLLLLSNT